MQSSEATDLVFSNPELLESILCHVPPLDLLVLQRVSTTFHDLISTSPPLQRNLFMRPDWTLEAAPYKAYRAGNRPGERPRNNRMLRRVLDGRYPTVTLIVTDADDVALDSTTELISSSPSGSFELGSKDRGQERPVRGHWSWDVSITFPADRLPSTDPAVLYEKASWRKMYLCQPPCTALHQVRMWQKAREPVIECQTGITMDLFVTKAARAKEAWNQLFIASDGDWHFEGPVKCSKVAEADE